MRIYSVDPFNPASEPVSRAAEILRAGGLVAFPTETVYGLGANALDRAAVGKIFEAKGRPSFNPLIVHVADEAAARVLTSEWPELATILADSFWPGPLTMVLRKAGIVPDLVTAGLPTVAVRVPAHPVARALLHAAEIPIAAPSANRFTELSPTTASHVASALGNRVDLILDGGPAMVGIESTVLDLTGERPVLLRPGTLSSEEIETLTGPLQRPPRIDGQAARPAPGMVERHYSPRAILKICSPEHIADLVRSADSARSSEQKVGYVLISRELKPPGTVRWLVDDPDLYARDLYATLHELDDVGCDVILVEAVPAGPAWAGVNDRLRRAAHTP
ncbi:L-threonylcarbamoyladenylate synthase [soil metagenome]